MSNSGSAFWGDPPANDNDRLILLGQPSAHGKFKIPPKLSLPPGEPVSHSTGFVVGIVFAIVLITLITGTRLASRIFHRKQKFGPDDIVIIPAVIFILAFLAVNLVEVSYAGLGKHVNYVTYAQLQLLRTMGYVQQVLFFAGVNLVKISMVLFNRRVIGISSKRWLIFHNIFIVLLAVWFFVSLFIGIFECNPVSALSFIGRATHPNFKCMNLHQIEISFSIINAITDGILFCIPIFVILKVRMPWGRKLRLVMVFGLGAICVSTSIVRTTLTNAGTSADYTWIAVQTVSWTIVDITFSAVLASLPALNGLFESAIAKISSQSSAFQMSWIYSSKSHSGQEAENTKSETQLNHSPSKAPVEMKPPADSFDELV